MSNWLSPDVAVLQEVVSASKGRLLLCSPYISTPGLNIVANALSEGVTSVEVWTKLDAGDWLTGVSDPEGLLDFTKQIEGGGGSVAIRHANNLHAKIIVSDGAKAIAGSANLTAGGFMRNLEVARVVTGREVDQLRSVVDEMRPKLAPISREQFVKFVSECAAQEGAKEALLDLIRQEATTVTPGLSPLMPYQNFRSFLESYGNILADEILRIARNVDGNNNTGKVKQAFYGVQRFLQEYPQHRETVESLPMEWFDVTDSPLFPDWQRFLDDFAGEVNSLYAYSIPTLRGYLPEAYGGTLRGGGGGSNELKRVWPFVARAVQSFTP